MMTTSVKINTAVNSEVCQTDMPEEDPRDHLSTHLQEGLQSMLACPKLLPRMAVLTWATGPQCNTAYGERKIIDSK